MQRLGFGDLPSNLGEEIKFVFGNVNSQCYQIIETAFTVSKSLKYLF